MRQRLSWKCGHYGPMTNTLRIVALYAACGYALLEWSLGTPRLIRQACLEPVRASDWDF